MTILLTLAAGVGILIALAGLVGAAIFAIKRKKSGAILFAYNPVLHLLFFCTQSSTSRTCLLIAFSRCGLMRPTLYAAQVLNQPTRSSFLW